MKIDIDELLKILPQLIRENDAVKGAIITALSGVVATHEDIRAVIEEMDRRFETMQADMGQHFEAVDRRFEVMQADMGQHFEAVDRRFEAMQADIGQHFEAVDRRFEAMQADMGQHFEAVDRRFDMQTVESNDIQRTVDVLEQVVRGSYTELGDKMKAVQDSLDALRDNLENQH
jgi:uncharacterized membrane-anchored protein YhcB (DUF1043 family)